MPSDEVDDSKVVENVHVPFKTSRTKDISVGSDTSIIDDGHTSYEDTSEVVDATAESGPPFDVDAHAHDISESAPELTESSVSSQISMYSFATLLIEDDIEHES